MSREQRSSFEAWSWAAFALGIATAALFVFLGSRPGGRAPVLAYRWGPLVLGASCAALLLFAILWSLRRRPALQRGRLLPLVVLAASLWLCSFPLAYPSSHEGHPSRVSFRLPFAGEALVRYGGNRREANPLLLDAARRFGSCFEPPSSAPLEVVAPAAGRLVLLETEAAGVSLVLEVAPREFLVIAGIEPGSCALGPGAEVDEGTPLGRAAGALFVHLQDGPRIGEHEGIPLRFHRYLADGRSVETGVPIPRQRVTTARPVDSP